MSRITARSAATRETILQAAARDFARLGYSVTTHATILQALGKSTPNYISYHFRTKADLAGAILGRQDELWGDSARVLAMQGVTGLDALVTMFFIALTDDENLPIFQAALVLDSDLAVPRTGTFQPCAAWMRLVTARLAEAKDSGQIPASTVVENEAWMIVSVLYGVYQVASQLHSTTELVARFERAWHGLLGGVGITDPVSVITAAQRHAVHYLGERRGAARENA